jgi:hypothetical protein
MEVNITMLINSLPKSTAFIDIKLRVDVSLSVSRCRHQVETHILALLFRFF